MAKHKTNLLVETKYLQIGYYEFLIFAFLLAQFLILTYDKVGDTNSRTAYLLTYEFGFRSQSLVGSVISIFTNKITSRLIYIISVVSFLALALQISFLLGKTIRESIPSIKSSVIIFVVLFLASPLSVTYLLGMHTERLDVYWIFITLLALVFLKKPVLRWTIPFLCAVAVSVHQGYMSTYMPALAIPMLYEVSKTKFSKPHAAVFGLSCFTMITFFIFFQFLPSALPFDNAADFAEHLSAKADFSASTSMLYIGFFAPFKEWFYGYTLPFTALYALPVGISYLLFSLPLLLIFIYIWKTSLKYTDSKFLKFVFFLCIVAPLVFFPAAIIANDWDRYWAAAINNQFIFIFYFIFSKEESVIIAVRKVGDFFERRLFWLLLIIIFTNALTYSQAATDIFSFIKDREATAKFLEDYFNNRIYG